MVQPATIMSDIAEDLAGFYSDPLGYVMWAFPWGEKGTQLEAYSGPRPWQREFLEDWGEQIRERAFDGVTPVDPIRMSRVSGHGIGKSALSAWIVKFIIDTRPFSKGVVTANTGDQLKTKTWGEMAKWHYMSITKDLFEYVNARGNMAYYNKEAKEVWRCDAMTCREENSEAFAGLHAKDSTPFYLVDEASAVPAKIFEVMQGGLTDGEPMQFLFGNGTRNTGYFRDTFGRMKHRWRTGHIDSRDVEGTNHELFQQWIDDYGEDSDFVRVRVLGQFPRAAVCQLISSETVEKSQGKHLKDHIYNHAPIVFGADVSWYGDDRCVLYKRQGLRADCLWAGREVDTVQYATIIAENIRKHRPDAIFIDAGAMGPGVIDVLKSMGHKNIPVYFGGRALKTEQYYNKRTEMWCEMRDWLEAGGAIPDRPDLFDDLIGPEYAMTHTGKIQLEKKEDMKRRGLSSPDEADALALTFAAPVYKQSEMDKHKNGGSRLRVAKMALPGRTGGI